MKPSPCLAIALSLSGFVAGCQDRASPPSVAEATEGLGSAGDGSASLAGRVVDDAYLPVAEAEVLLGTLHDVSDADGSFAFEGVPAGAATLSVAHPRFEPFAQDLVLAEAARLEVDVVLRPLPVEGPFVSTRIQNGFLACSFALNAAGSNACPEPLREGQKERFTEAFAYPGLRQFLWEVNWDSTWPETAAPWIGKLVLQLHSNEGPIVKFRIGFEHIRLIATPGEIFPSAPPGAAGDVTYRVVAAEFGCPVCGGELVGGWAYQQPFTVHLTLAYFRDFQEDESFDDE